MGVCFSKAKLVPEVKEDGADCGLGRRSGKSVERSSRHRLTIWRIQEDPNSHQASKPKESRCFPGTTTSKTKQSKCTDVSPSNFKAEQGSLIIKNRIIFEGALSRSKQQGFEEKRMNIQGESVKSSYLNQLGIAVACRKGLKPESPNQDDFCVVVDEKSLLLGVFDGHGPHGHDISDFVHSLLPDLIMGHEDFETNTCEAIRDSFFKAHDTLVINCNTPDAQFDCMISGTTASVALVKDGKLYMANVGDSRAVLAKRTSSGYKAKRISVDHKPNLPEEKSRIESKNGEVKQLPMDIPYRLFLKGREFPGISMSRAIGDTIAQSIGLISDPSVMCIDLEDEDEFILICSDGVWEFIDDQEAVEIIKPVEGNVKQGADRLATLAWSRWIQNEVDVVDDITVVACYLKGSYLQTLRLNKE